MIENVPEGVKFWGFNGGTKEVEITLDFLKHQPDVYVRAVDYLAAQSRIAELESDYRKEKTRRQELEGSETLRILLNKKVEDLMEVIGSSMAALSHDQPHKAMQWLDAAYEGEPLPVESPWKDAGEWGLPPIGAPVLIQVDGVVQDITYCVDANDKSDGLFYWFEPYHFGLDEDCGNGIPATKVNKWMLIPNG